MFGLAPGSRQVSALRRLHAPQAPGRPAAERAGETPFDPIAAAQAVAKRAQAASVAPAAAALDRPGEMEPSLPVIDPAWPPALRHAAQAYGECGAWLG